MTASISEVLGEPKERLVSTEIVKVGFPREVLEKSLRAAYNKIDYLMGLNNKLKKVQKEKRMRMINKQLLALSQNAAELHSEKQNRFKIEKDWREQKGVIQAMSKNIEILQGQLESLKAERDELREFLDDSKSEANHLQEQLYALERESEAP